MKTWLRITILLTLLVLPRPVAAHPMGNFSINHSSRIQVSSGAISIPTILDFAEMATFEMVPDPRRVSEHAREWASRLQLQAGSRTLPLELGSVHASDRSRELTAYPEDLLSSAPAMVSASVRIAPYGSVPSSALAFIVPACLSGLYFIRKERVK